LAVCAEWQCKSGNTVRMIDVPLWCVVCARTDDANVICASLLGTEVATDFDWWTLHSLWQQLKANLLLKASQVETVESAHRSSFRFCLEFNQVFPFAGKLKTYVPHTAFSSCAATS